LLSVGILQARKGKEREENALWEGSGLANQRGAVSASLGRCQVMFCLGLDLIKQPTQSVSQMGEKAKRRKRRGKKGKKGAAEQVSSSLAKPQRRQPVACSLRFQPCLWQTRGSFVSTTLHSPRQLFS